MFSLLDGLYVYKVTGQLVSNSGLFTHQSQFLLKIDSLFI